MTSMAAKPVQIVPNGNGKPDIVQKQTAEVLLEGRSWRGSAQMALSSLQFAGSAA